MKQQDPTLVNPPDVELVARVKAKQDSDALTTLMDRHSGAYFKVVNSYAASYPNVIKRADMDDDKMFNLYTFISSYDPARGMKLGTYIYDRTDYLCKTLLRKDERNPLSLGYTASGDYGTSRITIDGETVEGINPSELTYATNGTRVTLLDESAEAKVTEAANQDVAIEDIRAAAEEICTDKRFLDILQFRHFNAPKGALSWREIGRHLDLSHERVRQIYNENIELVKQHIGALV